MVVKNLKTGKEYVIDQAGWQKLKEDRQAHKFIVLDDSDDQVKPIPVEKVQVTRINIEKPEDAPPPKKRQRKSDEKEVNND